MGTDMKESESLDVKHNDRDLVQLAGYHAYKEFKEFDEINVNGKDFRVE